MVLEEKGQTMNRGKNEHIPELQVEIGKTLSEQRVRKGLTIQQVESVTKISQCFIDDIEHGQFDKLPGKIFGRGFIKSICLHLELDPAPIIEKYERSWLCLPEVKENKTPKTFSFFPRERSVLNSPLSPLRRFPMNKMALAVGIPVLLVLIAVVVRYTSDKRSAEPTVPTTASAPQETTAPATPVAVAPTPVAATNGAQVETIITPTSSPASNLSALNKEDAKKDKTVKELISKTNVDAKKEPEMSKRTEADTAALTDQRAVVVLNVKEEVKIRHRILPEDYTTTTFTPGVYRFPFEDRVDLHLFDASAVEINFNNKNFGSLGKKGEERKLTFFAKDPTPDAAQKAM